MTPERVVIIALLAVALAQGVVLYRGRRPAWWRRLDMHPLERLLEERFEATSNQLTRVVAGLHEDIDGLRQELRAMAQLPPETEIPRVIAELRWLRVAVAVALLLALALLVVEAARPAVAGAQAPAALDWHIGSRGPGVSWWYAYGCEGHGAIFVETSPPHLGSGWCSPGGVATVAANPGWLAVRAQGRLVAMRVALPQVAGGGP